MKGNRYVSNQKKKKNRHIKKKIKNNELGKNSGLFPLEKPCPLKKLFYFEHTRTHKKNVE